MLRKVWAFYKRDLQMALTYRFSFFYGLLQTTALFLSFFFIGKLVGGDYFRFVLVGIVFSGFMGTSLGGLSQTLSFERGHGTLETILLTPTSFTAVALGKIFWELTAVSLRAGIYVLVGIYLFKVDISQANWVAFIPVTVLTVTTFLGLGMISAGFLLIWRETGPLEFLIGGLSRFLAGVYFPVTVFPGWLKGVASWMPFTYALEAVRKSLIQGASLTALRQELAVLLGFSLFFIPVGYFFFRRAWSEARRQGSLGLQ